MNNFLITYYKYNREFINWLSFICLSSFLSLYIILYLAPYKYIVLESPNIVVRRSHELYRDNNNGFEFLYSAIFIKKVPHGEEIFSTHDRDFVNGYFTVNVKYTNPYYFEKDPETNEIKSHFIFENMEQRIIGNNIFYFSSYGDGGYSYENYNLPHGNSYIIFSFFSDENSYAHEHIYDLAPQILKTVNLYDKSIINKNAIDIKELVLKDAHLENDNNKNCPIYSEEYEDEVSEREFNFDDIIYNLNQVDLNNDGIKELINKIYRICDKDPEKSQDNGGTYYIHESIKNNFNIIGIIYGSRFEILEESKNGYLILEGIQWKTPCSFDVSKYEWDINSKKYEDVSQSILNYCKDP